MKYLREYNLRNPEEDNGQLDNYHQPYSFSKSVFTKLGSSFKNKLNPVNYHNVNAEDGYWFNDEDTLVIELPSNMILAELMKFFVNDFGSPDEFHIMKVGSKTILRIWWD